MPARENANSIGHWNPLEAMPTGHDYEVYHLLDENYDRGIIHSHAYYEFYYFIRGNIRVMIEDTSYEVRPYDFFLFPPGYMHRNVASREENLVYERAYFYLTEEMLRTMDSRECCLSEIMHGVVRENRFQFHLNRETCEGLIHRMDRIIETENSPDPLDRCINRARVMILVASMCSIMQHSISQEGVQSDPVITDVMQYISSHLTETLSLDRLAEQFFVSKYYMVHAFKEKTGTTIHQYLMLKRIVHAQMLMKRGVPPMQAARDSGFEDYTGFYRAFRNRTGYAPSEYIRLLGLETDE